MFPGLSVGAAVVACVGDLVVATVGAVVGRAVTGGDVGWAVGAVGAELDALTACAMAPMIL